MILYRSPECWGHVKISSYWGKHSPRVGSGNPLGPIFWCQQEGLIIMVICCKFKKNLFNLWLYTSFHEYSRSSGADNPKVQNFDVNRNLLSLLSFATSFKKSLWSLILYNFLHDFIHVYSPGAGADNPLGMKFGCQQEHLITLDICCKLKKKSLQVWFYTIFFMILYMYIAPGQGKTAHRGKRFDFNRNVLSLHSFVASLKKCLWSLILCNFFHDLIHVYSPGAGADSP